MELLNIILTETIDILILILETIKTIPITNTIL